MLLRIDDHELIGSLCAHYTRSGFVAQEAGGSMVEVRKPALHDTEQERREILMHLRVWNLLNPGTPVEPV